MTSMDGFRGVTPAQLLIEVSSDSFREAAQAGEPTGIEAAIGYATALAAMAIDDGHWCALAEALVMVAITLRPATIATSIGSQDRIEELHRRMREGVAIWQAGQEDK